MSTTKRKMLGFAGLAFAGCMIHCPSWAQDDIDAEEAQPVAASTPVWPSRFLIGADAFTVYPPQLERWEGDRLEGRAAVAVQAAGADRPVFGAVSLSARTEVDTASGMVTVHDIDASAASFPTATDRGGAYLESVRRHVAALTWVVALDRLRSDLAIEDAATRSQNEPLRNDPPRIVYVQSPTILVPIDGEPILREMPRLNLLRVVNTRALILQDKLTSRYFLFLAGQWLEAPALDGRWVQAQVRPMTLDEARRQGEAEGSVELLEDDQTASAHTPNVMVSKGPTELVQTDGPPQYAPIGRTNLLFVTNSPNRLFLDLRTQTHYVLLAGRWYRTRSLAGGPWDFVAGADLPEDFASIPGEHPTASVRAAVPGTAEAQEAVIANSVPQIATVKRSAARLEITYDGAPQFRPIEGTLLQAAENAPVPVIRVDWRAYYALDNGVWFFSESADGPWTAATSVPPAIYAIPRSDPLHYVTYVRVYDVTPEDIYVGYTPGYVGSYVSGGTTVVYGTGWYYRPWVGTVWFAPPMTWGFGFSVWYTWWNPWPPRIWWAGWRPAPCFRPAWGPWPHYQPGVKSFGVTVIATTGWPKQGHGVLGHGGGNVHHAAIRENGLGARDIYRRWDGPGVPSRHAEARRDASPSVRANDRSASFSPALSVEREQPGHRLERDSRIGQSDRRLDPPHWVGPVTRTKPQDRPLAPPDVAQPRPMTEQRIPARPTAAGRVPRSPGLWSGNADPMGGRLQSGGGAGFETHRQVQQGAPRYPLRDGSTRAATRDFGSATPPSGRRPPPGAVPAPGRMPAATTQQFRAPPRNRNLQQRDWRPAPSPALGPAPSMTVPRRVVQPMHEAAGAVRNGPPVYPR